MGNVFIAILDVLAAQKEVNQEGGNITPLESGDCGEHWGELWDHVLERARMATGEGRDEFSKMRESGSAKY